MILKIQMYFAINFLLLFQKDLKDLQKRLVVIGCQLRKTEISKRSYEVAVDKLTKFVEVSTTTHYMS